MGIDDPSSAERAARSDTLSITEPSSAKKFNLDDPTHKIDPSDYAVTGIEATARIAAYTLGILGPEIGPSGILAYLSGAVNLSRSLHGLPKSYYEELLDGSPELKEMVLAALNDKAAIQELLELGITNVQSIENNVLMVGLCRCTIS